jgi:hypothetical protein
MKNNGNRKPIHRTTSAQTSRIPIRKTIGAYGEHTGRVKSRNVEIWGEKARAAAVDDAHHDTVT